MEAMKTADRENPNRRVKLHSRTPERYVQNSSRSFQWAAKEEKIRAGGVFFLTSTFIELTGYVLGLLPQMDDNPANQALKPYKEQALGIGG